MDDSSSSLNPGDQATQIAIAVVEHDGKFLIGRRPTRAPLGGFWEFPGGKILPQESPEAAACRECLEETGLEIIVHGTYPGLTHEYDHDQVRLHFFACTPRDAAVEPNSRFLWVARHELGKYKFPEANRELLALLSAK